MIRSESICLVIAFGLFGIIIGVLPLYSSNQNSYFLHGLALAGVGQLPADWLAQTADPYPLFSRMVAIITLYLHESLFYALFLLLAALYAAGLVGIALTEVDFGSWKRQGALLLLLVIAVLHSGLVYYGTKILLGLRPAEWFTAGFAKQSILGNYLQPSTAGVFLILAVWAAFRKHPFLAVLLILTAAAFHQAYIFGGALLCLAILIDMVQRGQAGQALILGLIAGAVLLLIAGVQLSRFAPTDAALLAEAQRILVEVRIPHHALPEAWFDGYSLIRLALILGAFYVLRGSRLLLLLGIPFSAALLLAILQVFSGDRSLALLQPWRVSVFLVPVATAVLTARALQTLINHYQDQFQAAVRPLTAASAILLLCLALSGLLISAWQYRLHHEAPEMAVAHYIRQNQEPGALYLVPPQLERLRLASSAPIYVDWKSHPFKDVEVIAWYERYRTANSYYAAPAEIQCALLEEIGSSAAVNYVVEPLSRHNSGQCKRMESVYRDANYELFRLN